MARPAFVLDAKRRRARDGGRLEGDGASVREALLYLTGLSNHHDEIDRYVVATLCFVCRNGGMGGPEGREGAFAQPKQPVAGGDREPSAVGYDRWALAKAS